MAKSTSSVRFGPISVLTFTVILCLAVLAVLSISTVSAERSITERQEATTTETYQLETAGQEVLAALDAQLYEVNAKQTRVASSSVNTSAREAVVNAADKALSTCGFTNGVFDSTVDGTPVHATASRDETELTLTFSCESGRTLTAVLILNDNATYTVQSWKTTTVWSEDTGDSLWLG